MQRARFAFALVGVIAIAACSDIGQPFNTPNQAPVCIAAAGFQAQLATLRAIDPATATADEIKTDAYNAAGEFQTVLAQARVLAQAEATSLSVAVDTLQRTAQQLPDGMSASDTYAALQPQINAVNLAWQTLNSTLNCPPLPTAQPI
jgi:hypothetical protein